MRHRRPTHSAIVRLGHLLLVPGCLGLALPASRVSWTSPSLGRLAALRQERGPVPACAPDEALVGVRAIGLNYADVFCALGLYEAANAELAAGAADAASFCAGLEFSGVVLQVGDAASGVAVGDRVYGFRRFGAFRTVVSTRATFLRRLPEGWTFEEGASLLVQGLTAWYGLVQLGAARRGSRVLVHSAAGGVGCAAMALCDALGCEPVGLVGSGEKARFLQARFPGCTALVRPRSAREYGRRLDELEPFDVCLESLGGGYFSAALEHLAPMGRLVHFGATHAFGGSRVDGASKWLKLVPSWLARPTVDPGELVGSNRGVLGFNLIWLTEREQLLAEAIEAMTTAGGLLSRPPAVGRCFGFEQLPEALAYLRSGASVGKVVVTVEGDGGPD